MKKKQFQKLCARLTIIFMTVILLAAVPLPRGISKAGIQAYASVSQKRSVKTKINEKRKKVTKKKKLKKSMQLLQMMDAYRQSKGLGEFYKNAVLTKAAMQRSIEITTVFDHTRPDGKPWYTVDPYVSGENIAAGYQTAVQFMSSFANSPTHNANLLNANFKTAGVAVFVEKGPYGYTYFVTQLFGR